ncbi:EF-hand domain-containing protein [Sphingomonas sp. BT-65]|uniref:EF-hand domain-containing protein n=1 Tax=Sphingomonas sp. BT-65 TaxID=2989821 RepID=UPI0022363F60|nr:EF-hand domain-containing protein [Sphingomonas sp. BT-65]MCW4461666.1 EF-hand domain-containing protein [Sphingomonas sp. BT-65]
MSILFLLAAAQTAPLGVAPGPLPKAEAERRVAERFADLDLNEDGAIERDEVRARFDFEASTNATFTAAQKARKAGDPRPTVDARQPAFAKADSWFAAVDTDKDGKISREELTRYLGADIEQLGVK